MVENKLSKLGKRNIQQKEKLFKKTKQFTKTQHLFHLYKSYHNNICMLIYVSISLDLITRKRFYLLYL